MQIEPNTAITFGLAGTIAVCVLGGLAALIWLYSKFDAQRREGAKAIDAAKAELLDAIAGSRRQGDERMEDVARKLDAMAARQQDHEIDVERRFVSKDSAAASYGRLEAAMTEVRGDVRNLIATVSANLRVNSRGRGQT